MALRDKFNPFYQKTKIRILTEDQVRRGVEAVGIDTLDSNAHQLQLGVKPDKGKKYVKCQYRGLSEDDPEVAMNQKDKSQIKMAVPASALHPSAEDVVGLEDEADAALFDNKVIDLEAKEADIIHDLYTAHFVVQPTQPVAPALTADAKQERRPARIQRERT